jgi:hypothetical protein
MRIVIAAALLGCMITLVGVGQDKSSTASSQANQAKIARALSAAPPNIAKDARS